VLYRVWSLGIKRGSSLFPAIFFPSFLRSFVRFDTINVSRLLFSLYPVIGLKTACHGSQGCDRTFLRSRASYKLLLLFQIHRAFGSCVPQGLFLLQRFEIFIPRWTRNAEQSVCGRRGLNLNSPCFSFVMFFGVRCSWCCGCMVALLNPLSFFPFLFSFPFFLFFFLFLFSCLFPAIFLHSFVPCRHYKCVSSPIITLPLSLGLEPRAVKSSEDVIGRFCVTEHPIKISSAALIPLVLLDHGVPRGLCFGDARIFFYFRGG